MGHPSIYPCGRCARLPDADAETRSGGGSRWVARLPDLGSPACNPTEKLPDGGTTAESANNPKKKQRTPNKICRRERESPDLKNKLYKKHKNQTTRTNKKTKGVTKGDPKTDRPGRVVGGGSTGRLQPCLNGQKTRRLKHQNLESSKASEQKQHSDGEGRQRQERRERKGGKRENIFFFFFFNPFLNVNSGLSGRWAAI
ncbi:hypothetical protein SLEP1_g15549 [Rubroshorea leprosula]|uniref:Uncharacterized protein n=1 Tax=Rubroshorea leprosula TaxID=152421 RepID=A0AAV5ITK3_9ROSI|nr:hypothetical protein SLEP1_g15549 [Rubroshorea leprosula]